MFILFGLNEESDFDAAHPYFIGCFSTYDDANAMRSKLYEESGKPRSHFFSFAIKEIVVGEAYGYEFPDSTEA
jgi:hypothetical protein